MEKTIYEKIDAILIWYHKNSTVIQSIDNLLDAQDKLVLLSVDLAKSCALSKTNSNLSYFMKVISVERSTQNLMKQDMAYNKAKSEAMLMNEDKFKQEIVNEGLAFGDDLLLKQINKVLGAMSQRISYIKKDFNPHNNNRS